MSLEESIEKSKYNHDGNSWTKTTKKHYYTDDNEVKRWSDLPNELLELIKKRLFYADQQNLREVCKSWSSIDEEERLVPPLQQMPWLLVFDETDSGKLIDPKYKKTYQVEVTSIRKKIKISSVKRIPLLHKVKWDVNEMLIRESKYGWLLVSFTDPIQYPDSSSSPAGTTFFLYSPFLDQDDNNNCIELPILSFNTVCMATFTSNPLDIEACTVVSLNQTSSDTIFINTYRRGQSSWNKLIFKCDQLPLSDAKRWMCTDECIFYYVLGDGRVGTFDLAREEWHVFPPLPTTMRETLQSILLCWKWYQHAMVYMVKSGGELFLISERNLSLKTIKVSEWSCKDQYIYRLDLSSMIWEDLNNVGERVLFIGDGYRSVLKSNGELKGISNTIYNCSRSGLKYCTVHDYTVRNFDKGFPQRHDCDIHYGSISREGFVKVLIDPPHLHH